MKTPREILLERHQPATPKLDAIRKNVLASECQPATRSSKLETRNESALPLKIAIAVWRELIWPARRIWAGLAAAWLLILAVNLNLKAGGPGMSATNSSGSADFMMALREQEQIMAELTQRPEPKAVEPPKQFAPQPRSQGRTEMKV